MFSPSFVLPGQQHAKLTDLVHKDFLYLSTIESQLTG
jgi:hypothetical protein